jgi:hypothetical protein
MSIIEDRGISKDYSKWWAKQGEEPQDLLLVRQNTRLYKLLLPSMLRYISVLQFVVIIFDDV